MNPPNVIHQSSAWPTSTSGFAFLITAGNTRQAIDEVRAWSNIFTGNTGFDLALALSTLGRVDLLSSNPQHPARLAALPQTQHPIHITPFVAHADLLTSIDQHMTQRAYHAVYMTAAVADYQPAGTFSILQRQPAAQPGEEIWHVRNVQAPKVKSHHPQIAILGQPTEKIIDLFRSRWQHRGLLFKFKLEVALSDEQLLAIARQSRLASAADVIVANTLAMVQGQNPGAYVIDENQSTYIPRPQLAQHLTNLTHQRLSAPPAHRS